MGKTNKADVKKTEVVCVRSTDLKRMGYDNLRDWMNAPDNVYMGSRGRIFVDDGVYHYADSNWKSPWSMMFYNLKCSLQKYMLHLFETGLIYDISELRGRKLSCFCDKHIDTNTGEALCVSQLVCDMLNNKWDTIKKFYKAEPQRVLICGDRKWKDKTCISDRIKWKPKTTIIINGGCKGVDTLASELGTELGMEVLDFSADWEKHGRSAGPKRNAEMIKMNPHVCYAFHNKISDSKGTKDMINKCLKADIPVYLYNNSGGCEKMYRELS